MWIQPPFNLLSENLLRLQGKNNKVIWMLECPTKHSNLCRCRNPEHGQHLLCLLGANCLKVWREYNKDGGGKTHISKLGVEALKCCPHLLPWIWITPQYTWNWRQRCFMVNFGYLRYLYKILALAAHITVKPISWALTSIPVHALVRISEAWVLHWSTERLRGPNLWSSFSLSTFTFLVFS